MDNPVFENANDEGNSSFETEQSPRKSPTSAKKGTALGDDDGAEEEPQAVTAELEHELTDDELSSLTYAFQACDIDGAGTIEPDELYAMMASLGAEVDLRTVQLVMKESTEKFQVWLDEQKAKEASDVAVELPSELRHDEDESGHHGSTKHGGKRHHTELGIQQRHVLVRIGQHPALAPVRVPMKYSAKIMYISGKVVASPVTVLAKRKKEDPYVGMSEEEKAKAMEEAMLSDQHMTFAEFMYMMAHREVLDKLVPGDWHQSSAMMRKYRHAFGKVPPRVALALLWFCRHPPSL